MSLVKWAIFGLLLLPLAEIAVFVAVALKLGVLLLLPATRRWIHAALRRAVGRADLGRAERTGGRPGVVDLAPDQWRRVPEERIGRKPSAGQD